MNKIAELEELIKYLIWAAVFVILSFGVYFLIKFLKNIG